MGKVILFGIGQVASRAYWYLTHDSQHEVVAFTVDREYIKCPAPTHCTTFRVSLPPKYPLLGMMASGAGGL